MARVWFSWFLVGIVLGLCAGARAEDEPCTLTDGDKFYDLNPLKSKKDYKFTSTDGHEYSINVCQPVTGETWALQIDDADRIGGYTRREHGDFSLGYSNTTLTVRDGNPTITMASGSPCPTHHHMHAATTVHFKCDTSISGTGEPVLIAQLPPPEDSSCYFFIEWKTNIACPTRTRTSSSSSWGFFSVLASIIGTLLVVYVVSGSLYNYLVLNLRGLDVIPRCSLVSLKDSLNVFRTCFARVSERSSGAFHSSGHRGSMPSGYRGLAVSRDEEEGMLSGPPGFLDDEDDEPEHDTHNGQDPNGVIRL